MTFLERNKLITELLNDFQAEHDKYTSSTRILTDEEWEQYIHSMELRLHKLKKTNLHKFAEELWMAFLNDTEDVQKKLRAANDKL